MRITQVLVGAAPGDAVTASAFEIQALLGGAHATDIRAQHIDPGLAGRVHPLAGDPDDRSCPTADDLLVVHVSIGEPVVSEWILARPERLVLVYHNIAPAEPFEAYDPAFAALLVGGRQELEQYRDRTVLALADSAFNARELEDLGFVDVRVTPLVVDPYRLHHLAPDGPTEQHLAGWGDDPVVLFVGQLLPHKRPDYLIEAFHTLATYRCPEARLIMVGAGRLPAYRRALQVFIDELGLSAIWLTGAVSDPELAAFYRAADVFVTASEHEGFCVPLLEAMAFDLPIVARDFAAIPETLGGAGLLFGRHDPPEVFAEGVAAILGDPGGRAELRARGRTRIRSFDPGRARTGFLRQLRSLF